MTIARVFATDVTRDIAPVVYFHEQSPEKLAEEVGEYIITGGWPEGHPNHQRVKRGIHEEYVSLLGAIATELDKKGGPDLPTVWISGFYGSGKSSFAKLLGLSLNKTELPDGGSVAEAWLKRDTSPKSSELRAAWSRLLAKIDPIAVVFDVGSIARAGEHIHAACVRQVQERLGYCVMEAAVADFELKLERDGSYGDFEQKALAVLGKPWSEAKSGSLAEEDFSLVMSELYPRLYTDPMAWLMAKGGAHLRTDSPEDAVRAIEDMLRFRATGATLFLVVDEVSQYVHSSKDRGDRLRAFASALGARLRGRVWLLALGQQKLDEAAGDDFLVWAKDRFPPKLRVHLAPTNIGDVVHKRLLHKTAAGAAELKTLFEGRRQDLKLYAYGCEDISPDEFAEAYPMLPRQMELVLSITSELRRSSQAQSDDHAIRGLLQLLGELFRAQKLADRPLGDLVTLVDIYEVQHTALDSDTQSSLTRIFKACEGKSPLYGDVVKAVALLQLIQEQQPTTAKLVSQCLYARMGQPSQEREVEAALEELRGMNLLSRSEKIGYKIQSSAAEEWDAERDRRGVARERISEAIAQSLKNLLSDPEKPRYEGRPFPWAGVYSDGRKDGPVTLLDPRDPACVRVELQGVGAEEREGSRWVQRSGEPHYANVLLWVAGDTTSLDDAARDWLQSQSMIERYLPQRASLIQTRRDLLQQEGSRAEELKAKVKALAEATWMAGVMYFRGRAIRPAERGARFAAALVSIGTTILPELFPQFSSLDVQPAELLTLLRPEVSGVSEKFGKEQLGLLELERGHVVFTCTGTAPKRIEELLRKDGGVEGSTLLATFGGPPYGYTAGVIRACLVALLRGGRLRIEPEGATAITSVRDFNTEELFKGDQIFRRATFSPGTDGGVDIKGRARICAFFKDVLGQDVGREADAIADAVQLRFPGLAKDLREVQAALNRLPGSPEGPAVFPKLQDALEQAIRSIRQTALVVDCVSKKLDILRDGTRLLKAYRAELDEGAIESVRKADALCRYELTQLREAGVLATNVDAAGARITEQLGREKPWSEIVAIADDLSEVRRAYKSERERLIAWQGEQIDAARATVKRRDGYATLTADQSNRVLRPFFDARIDTTAEAVAPTLVELEDPFKLRLGRAVEQADRALDEILSEGDKPIIVRMELQLKNREVKTAEDVEALVAEIRERLMAQVAAGVRVRIS